MPIFEEESLLATKGKKLLTDEQCDFLFPRKDKDASSLFVEVRYRTKPSTNNRNPAC